MIAADADYTALAFQATQNLVKPTQSPFFQEQLFGDLLNAHGIAAQQS
jgi:hypothetical protein